MQPQAVFWELITLPSRLRSYSNCYGSANFNSRFGSLMKGKTLPLIDIVLLPSTFALLQKQKAWKLYVGLVRRISS
jgi:hypothetical protein